MTTSDTFRPVEAEATTDSLDLTTDVVIVGGGLAGLTLGAALATAGVPVICLDRDTPPTQMEQDFDGRTTALAFCSKQVLDGAGVWKHMADDAEAILDIRVVDQDSPLFLHYDHQDVGIGPFCWKSAGIGIVTWKYNQSAMICNIAHDQPHCGVAVEKFLPGGPFAILPLTENRSSIVWSEQKSRVPMYMGLSDAAFTAELQKRG